MGSKKRRGIINYSSNANGPVAYTYGEHLNGTAPHHNKEHHFHAAAECHRKISRLHQKFVNARVKGKEQGVCSQPPKCTKCSFVKSICFVTLARQLVGRSSLVLMCFGWSLQLKSGAYALLFDWCDSLTGANRLACSFTFFSYCIGFCEYIV